MLLVAVSPSPWRSPLSPGVPRRVRCGRRDSFEPLIGYVTSVHSACDEHKLAVTVRFEDLALTHVRVGSALSQCRHASLNHPQRLARRPRIAFFGFLDGLIRPWVTVVTRRTRRFSARRSAYINGE